VLYADDLVVMTWRWCN